MKERYYSVDICGRTEKLPVIPISDTEQIAFFNLHGAQELTEYCAKLLSEKLSDCEIIITAESKGLQLAHCIARNLGHKFYAVARKSKKLYLTDCISSTVHSITTSGEQTLYLSRHDKELLKDKKVGIIDDVISTGSSLLGLEMLVEKSGGIITKRAFVLAEGDAIRRNDIIYLAEIPILKKN